MFESVIIEILVVLFSAIFSFIVCYLVYDSFAVAVWGYIAAFLPRIPVIVVSVSGGTNLTTFAWLSHTAGILVYPLALAVIDILFLEIALVSLTRPVSFLLPKNLQTAIKVDSFLNNLQHYHAVPTPVRVQWVYGAGVLAGVVNLIFVMGFRLI